ncbi:hypothetical protein GYMLUDRAFT_763961 [Collybiopsis luxurians FD-317 M1]|uniref:Uncharacterized protein n=1 Tax=Collybiopsis luxurians FD-317 M1 TaxID=944289 RepID=A0A0D0BQ34_9AGAR|nr:hypothetical protein GYMLUDRAFT_763961 [Collybiopsis luxurians FD-317 M1]
MIYAWIGIVTFDICVIFLTLWKSLRMRKECIPGGIMTVIMRDGILYFGIIAVVNVTNILTFALGSGFTRNLLPIISNVIASLIMSRLMLNIRGGQSEDESFKDLSVLVWQRPDSEILVKSIVETQV